MKKDENYIIDQVNNLIKLMLNKGVQAEELMENIGTEGYLSISAKKTLIGFECSVKFEDTEIWSNKKSKYEYLYTYNNEKFLQEIKMIKSKKQSILWNRDSEEALLINHLIESFTNKEEADEFIKTLPDNLISLIKEKRANRLFA